MLVLKFHCCSYKSSPL